MRQPLLSVPDPAARRVRPYLWGCVALAVVAVVLAFGVQSREAKLDCYRDLVHGRSLGGSCEAR